MRQKQVLNENIANRLLLKDTAVIRVRTGKHVAACGQRKHIGLDDNFVIRHFSEASYQMKLVFHAHTPQWLINRLQRDVLFKATDSISPINPVCSD